MLLLYQGKLNEWHDAVFWAAYAAGVSRYLLGNMHVDDVRRR